MLRATRLRPFSFLLLVLLFVQPGARAFGQTPVPADTTGVEKPPAVIPVEMISTETKTLLQSLDNLESVIDAQAAAKKYDSIVSSKLDYINDLKDHVKLTDLGNRDYLKAERLKTDIIPMKVLYETSLKTISDRIDVLNKGIKSIAHQEEQWRLTYQQARSENWVPTMQERIRDNVRAIDRTTRKAKRLYNEYLSRQDRLTTEIIYLDELSRRIQQIESNYRSLIFEKNDPAIWELFDSLGSRETLGAKISQAKDREVRTIALFYASYKTNLYYHLLIFISLLVILYLIRHDVSKWSDETRDGDIKRSLYVINHPFSTAILIAVFFNRILYPQASPEALEYFFVFLIIPIINLIPGIYYTVPRKYFVYIGLLFLAMQFVGKFRELVVLDRIATLIISTLIIIFLASMLAVRSAFEKESLNVNWRLLRNTIRISLGFAVISILSNVFGNTVLTSIILNGITALIFGGLIIFSCRRAVKSLFSLALQHGKIASLHIMTYHKEAIKRWFSRILNLAAITIWIALVLDNFMALDPVWMWLTGILSNPWQFGSVELTLGSVLGFFLTLWITVVVSKFVRFMLKEEILPRFTMARGVPGAISLMVRLTLLAIGFTIALGVAKVELTKITIIIGALGVGIGFGLQNIFNNLISGLILAFERPIQVGDMIQLSTLNIIGEVKEIGIRASTIRSFDGAEIIVPNGNMISSEMINWTLSDRRRRQEIVVGVAYGTDTTKVLEVLNKVIQESTLFLKEPSPLILFNGFGDSSLDFRILFWTYFDDGLTAKSKMGLAIDQAFKDAGIEIPFPQRDIHIRSGSVEGL